VDEPMPSQIPLSYDWGAGLINAKEAINLQSTDRHRIENPVTQDGWTWSPIDANDTSPYAGLTGDVYLLKDLVASNPFTATLNWYRHVVDSTPSSLVDLDLILYRWNGTTATMVAVSDSKVDNLEHIFLSELDADGDYLLRVAVTDLAGRGHEIYALSWDIAAPQPIPEPNMLFGAWLTVLGLICHARRR
jgi:hypothetical protein